MKETANRGLTKIVVRPSVPLRTGKMKTQRRYLENNVGNGAAAVPRESPEGFQVRDRN
jgi:hypothetical protein